MKKRMNIPPGYSNFLQACAGRTVIRIKPPFGEAVVFFLTIYDRESSGHKQSGAFFIYIISDNS